MVEYKGIFHSQKPDERWNMGYTVSSYLEQFVRYPWEFAQTIDRDGMYIGRGVIGSPPRLVFLIKEGPQSSFKVTCDPEIISVQRIQEFEDMFNFDSSLRDEKEPRLLNRRDTKEG